MSFPFRRIRHLLVDLDGVIYTGNTALPGAERFVSWLHAEGIAFQLVTNNATLTPAQYVSKLEAMGIRVDAGEVFTSALATALYLQKQGAEGQSAYVIGEDGLMEALREINIRLVTDAPDWVIVGLDRNVTYEKLSTAALALASGARFLGTNPDRSLPSEKGLLPGAGAIQAALVATTGVEPVIVGKPRPLMLQLGLEKLGGTAEDTAMLGDRLDTDIEGAAVAGIPSILVLTGVSRREDLARARAQPSLVVQDLGELMRRWSDRAA